MLDYISTGVPTYGVTTDFGDSCYKQISVDKAGELQRELAVPVYGGELALCVGDVTGRSFYYALERI